MLIHKLLKKHIYIYNVYSGIFKKAKQNKKPSVHWLLTYFQYLLVKYISHYCQRVWVHFPMLTKKPEEH